MIIKIITKNEEETLKLGVALGKLLFKNSVCLLTGDLGAGKTTLTKGIAKGLGINQEVNSPTFNILKCYFNKPLSLYHIDSYRLEDVSPENKNIGLEEVIDGGGVSVIEWPMFIEEFIPENHLDIDIRLGENNSRNFTIECKGKNYDSLIESLKEMLNV